MDPRVEAYAKLLVERSLGVEPGWQVWINSSWLARPLVQKVVRQIGRRGAYPLVRLGDAGMEDIPFEVIWALEAPEQAFVRSRTGGSSRLGDDGCVDEHRRSGEHGRGARVVRR